MNHRFLWLPFSVRGLLLLLVPAAVPRAQGVAARRSPAVLATAFRDRFSEVSAAKESDPKAPSTREVETSDFLRLSPKWHVASVAAFVAGAGLLHVEPVAKCVERLLLRVPCASWDPATRLHPLSAANWVAHVIMQVFALELAGGFFSLMRRSGNDAAKKTYTGYFVVYAAAYAYSLLTMFSHAVIGVNATLEHVLANWFVCVMRTASIFGSGLAVAIGPWTLLPVFAGVNIGLVGYDTWLGRVLATLSVYKYFVSEIPALFRYSFLGMSVVPAMIAQILRWKLNVDDPYTESDGNHILVASVLVLFSVTMSYSLNRKVKYGEE